MRTMFAASAMAIAVVASGCTFQLRDPGVSASCGPLNYEVNTNGYDLGSAQRQAIDQAFDEYATLVGRTATALGDTTATIADHTANDPVLVEINWPSDAPEKLGFASPDIVDNTYTSGWIYLNPSLAQAPPGLIRRLTLHEIGHLSGLDDVSDPAELMDPSLPVDHYGSGDMLGLTVTHNGGCEGSTLTHTLIAQAAAQEQAATSNQKVNP